MNRPTVVLVHGMAHRSWCWTRVIPRLRARGINTVAVDLPSCGGPDGEHYGDMLDDVEHIWRTINAVGGPVVLCGHSRGGYVLTGAGAHPAVRHLVYLTALMHDPGADTRQYFASGPKTLSAFDAIRSLGHGLIGFEPSMASTVLYNTCSPADAEWATSKLVATSAGGRDAPPITAFRRTPSTYVICERDNAIPVAGQRLMARNASRVVSWPYDHSPFLCAPDKVASLLADVAA